MRFDYASVPQPSFLDRVSRFSSRTTSKNAAIVTVRRIGARGTLASLIAIAAGGEPGPGRGPGSLRVGGAPAGSVPAPRDATAGARRRTPCPHGQADRAARSFPHRVGGPRRAPWITGGRPPLLAPSLTTGQLARTVAFAGIPRRSACSACGSTSRPTGSGRRPRRRTAASTSGTARRSASPSIRRRTTGRSSCRTCRPLSGISGTSPTAI